MILTDTIWPMPPCINATISIIKKFAIQFFKNEGGSKAIWNFSKNSSDLVAGSFPKVNSFFFLVIIHSQLPFYLDETNLQAAFDKLIFVELAIFVDIKLVEHHLRILLRSVLEKCSAGERVALWRLGPLYRTSACAQEK